MAEKPKQIQAIDLVKGLFEHIQGNYGLLRFTVEKLEPNNGVKDNIDAMKWIVIVSFYQTPSSDKPVRYHANVNLDDKTVSFREVLKDGTPIDKSVPKKYQIVEDKGK